MDPKFRKWLSIVCPSETVAARIAGEREPTAIRIDWNSILEILLTIFKLLAMFGCLAARRYSARVKAAMTTFTDLEGKRDGQIVIARLMEIRDDMERSKSKKETQMRLFMILAFLPTLLFAQGGIQTDANGHKFLYSPKYQKKFYLGLTPHAKPTKALKSFAGVDVKVPNDFSWKDLKGLPPGFPLDQGQCGSCVVNSIIGNVTFNLWIRGILPASASPLSRGQVMNCNPTAGQCSGDWAENVGGWVVKHGGRLLSESVYPYSPNNGSCRSKSGTEYSESYAIPRGSVIDNSEESIGKALVVSGPLSTTVGADNTWMNAGTSVYTSCTNQGTNHEVLIIGIHARGAARGADGYINFAAAKPGDIVIDILNSWGDWADGGIIHTVVRSSSGRLCNNVTEEVYAFEFPALNTKPATCAVKVDKKEVLPGGTVTVSFSSENAAKASANGKDLKVPTDTFLVTADATLGAKTVTATAFNATNEQVTCSDTYTVATSTGGLPAMVWAILIGLVLIGVAYLVGRFSK